MVEKFRISKLVLGGLAMNAHTTISINLTHDTRRALFPRSHCIVGIIYVLMLSFIGLGRNSAASSIATAIPNTDRVAIVTGANKGIGYHIALQLASSDMFSHVILGCRDETRGMNALRKMKHTLDKSSHKCILSFVPLTIGDKDSHESFRNTMESKYNKVDVLVNNAAFAFKKSSIVPFELQCGPTLDVNFYGTVDFTETMLPLIRKGMDARIVNVASKNGLLAQLPSSELREKFVSDFLTIQELRKLVRKFEHDVLVEKRTQNGWGDSNYSLSKLALIAATKIWAREESINVVKVNCCCPGHCDTDMSSHKGPRTAADGAKNAVLPATMPKCGTGVFYQNLQESEW